MANVRAGDPFVCVWCEQGLHQRCWVPGCECVHAAESWIQPARRAELRAGAEPVNEHEEALAATYLSHRAEREAADARRR